MSKGKYKFNPESLSYDKIEHTIKEKFIKFFTYFSASLALAVIYHIVFTLFLDLPKEKILKRELSQMKLQYEILNKQLNHISVVLADIQNRDDNIYRTIFNAEPIPSSIRTAGFGGVNRYNDLDGFDNSRIVIETAQNLDVLKKQMYVQSRSFDEIIDLSKNKEQMLASIPSIQPIAINDLRRIGGFFGMRIHPILKIFRMHEGMDFAAPVGTEVYVTGNGVVTDVEFSRARRGYGNMIEVDHGFGYKTIYAHLEDIKVKVGQRLKRGEVIGTVGNTGLSTAPHLHYEIRKGGKPINPINYYFNDLTPEEFDLMIELSQQGGSFLGM